MTDSTSSSFEMATTTPGTARKRPFQEIRALSDRSGGSLTRIRQIRTFSIDYEDGDDDDGTMGGPPPKDRTSSSESEIVTTGTRTTTTCTKSGNDNVHPSSFSANTFPFDYSFEHIFMTPGTAISTNATAYWNSSNLSWDDGSLPQSGGVESRAQLLFKNSPTKDDDTKGILKSAVEIPTIDRKAAPGATSFHQPFPEGVLITPNDDDGNQKNKKLMVPEFSTSDVGNLCMMGEDDVSKSNMANGMSLRPKLGALKAANPCKFVETEGLPMEKSPNNMGIEEVKRSKVPLLPQATYTQTNPTMTILNPTAKRPSPNYKPRLYNLPLPDSMKPIIRILLHLEEDYHHDPELVRDAFSIVQTCIDKPGAMTSTMTGQPRSNNDLNGSIFESIVENLRHRVDLAAVFQAAPSTVGDDSPNLMSYFDSSSCGDGSGGGDPPTKRKRGPKKTVSKATIPNLLQLAVAYGMHAAKSAAEVKQKERMKDDTVVSKSDLREIIYKCAKTVGAMSKEERIAFWKIFVEMNDTNC